MFFLLKTAGENLRLPLFWWSCSMDLTVRTEEMRTEMSGCGTAPGAAAFTGDP